MSTNELLMKLDEFVIVFNVLNEKTMNNIDCSNEIENKLGDFTDFILNKENEKI